MRRIARSRVVAPCERLVLRGRSPAHRVHAMPAVTRRLPIGAELSTTEPGARVRVWAPTHPKVTLVVESPHAREIVLGRGERGYHSGFVPGLAAGARYRFRIGDDPRLHADPASRFQPEGPFGPSELIDPGEFAWTDIGWRGIPRERHVLYELHVGTFTPEGTWNAAAQWLPYLADLGITTVELMPVAEFAGTYNWGYDGVNLYAPTRNYGTPDDMRRFVDRAHACRLGVILDVVYNHFGPAGNSMFTWSPYFRSDRLTEWGEALNFDQEGSAGVREYMIENAGYWIDEFHLDGLRFDATQTLVDTSPEHVLTAIARRARDAGHGRHIFLVAENEPQNARLLHTGLDALWNDDFHHTARVASTGLIEGYLHDYRGSAQELVSALKRGFLYQGQLYPWQRNPRGASTRGLSRNRFVHFLENHDQIANIGFGERLITQTDPATLRALTAVLLLAPQIPMLFQGQETGSRSPWLFFVDHGEELADPVRKGRAEFVAQFPRQSTREARAAMADPCAQASFTRCKLDPGERSHDSPAILLHRELLRLRREQRAFTDPRPDALDGALLSDRAFVIRYFQDRDEDDRLLVVNLGPTFSQVVVPEPLIAPPANLGWSVLWSSEDPRYGGHGTPMPFDRVRLAIPAHAAVVFAPDPRASLFEQPSPPSGDHVPVEP